MPVSVLLVENSTGDVRLAQEAFRDINRSVQLQVASDGAEAMALLRHTRGYAHAPRPACILLDLNLPGMDGREVLSQIKKDDSLKGIPTIVLSTSQEEADITRSYQHHANCYLSKPGRWDSFEDLIRNINEFWLNSIPAMGGKGLIAPPGTPSHNVPAASLAAPEVILPESVGFGTRQREAMRAFGEHGMTIEVLLVEDSPGDVRLTQEAFRDANRSIHLHVASDGVEAMAFLRQEEPYPQAPRPHLILLDLNLPRMDGREVLALIKDDDRLKTIPTVILTTSDAEADIVKSYELQANCYLSKPVQLDAFESLVKSINDFWLTKAKLPQ